MKRPLWIRVIAMILVLCMVLASCKKKDTDTDSDNTPDDSVETPGDTPDPVPPECKHENTTTKNAKPTGCTAPGYTGDKVCSACGVIVEKGSEIPQTQHQYDEGLTTKNPTCMEEGTYTYTCTGCGLTKFDSLPTVPHDDQYHDALDGTHNHTCTTCTMTENAVHTPVDEGVYHAASCLESAYTELTCSLCGGVYKEYIESESALGHNWNDKWNLTEATCVADGHKTRSCDRCGEEESIVLPATPDVHNFVFAKYDPAPTCADEGIALYVCADCGAEGPSKTVAATGNHDYKVVQDNGDGWIISECSVCGKEVSKFDASHLVEAEVKTDSIPDDKPFEVTTQNATIEFPTDVIGQMKGDSGESRDVSISAGTLEDSAKEDAINKATNLTDEQKERLNDVTLYDFNVTISGSALSDNFATAVTVTIPYELKTFLDEDGNLQTEDKEGIVIWYVGANGDITEIADVVYNEETKTVTFLAPHFSMYAVAYKETQEMMCRRGHHAYVAIESVEASCATHGYTLYECECCHRKTVDDIVEKKKHNYGDIIAPNPTCESGDYYHQICVDCGDVLNIQYVRALGHILDQVASCDKGSTCSRCNRVVTPPLGHNWSDWRVVVEPGELSAGLKSRYCSRCGKVEMISTASIGDVTALEFESYEQMAKAIYDLVVGLDNGVIEFTYTMNGSSVYVKATVNETKEDLLIGVDYVITSADGIVEGSAIYRNGVIILDTLETNPDVGVVTLDTLMYAPVNVAFEFMRIYHSFINPYAEMYLGMAREELNKYILAAGEDINKALEAAGSPYTVEDLCGILDSVETVYAYVSLKLGCSTSAQIKDGVLIPTKNDLIVLLKSLMEETADGENKTYSVNAEPLVEAIETVLGWVNENQTKSIAALVFELLGEEIAKLDPTITDINTLATYLKINLPGTMKVKDVLDKVVTLLEESGVITLPELYGIINTLVVEATPYEEFDVEAMITEYYNVTLNDFVAMQFGEGATVEQLYDMLVARATEITLGSLPVGEATVSQYVSMLSAQLESLVVKADFSFTVDKNGKLVELNIDELLNMLMPGEKEGEFVEYPLQNLTVTITRDESVKAVIPDRFVPVNVDVKTYFDENGNFVISGIPSDFKLEIGLSGSYKVNLKDILHKDTDMSSKLGYDVYVAHKDLWTATQHIAEFIVIDGKYYTYTREEFVAESDDKLVTTVDVFEFIENPYIVIPDSDDKPLGSYKGTELYNTPIGYMAQYEGEWWVCDASVYYDLETDTYEIHYISQNYRFSERFNSANEVRLSSISEGGGYYYGYGNASVSIYSGVSTYSFGAITDNGKVLLVHSAEGYSYNKMIVIGEEKNIKDYTYDEIHTGQSQDYISINGEVKYSNVEYAYLIKKLPTYYVEVVDGIYANIESYGLGNYNTNGLAAMELGDGNTLYVVGEASAVEFNYTYGDIYYGYVKLTDELCIRAFCVVQDGHVVEICYEGSSSSARVYYEDVYDLNRYTTIKDDGTIVIAKDLVTLLKMSCATDGDHAGIYLWATKSVGEHIYCIRAQAAIEFSTDNLDVEDIFGGSSSQYDIFERLFGGKGEGSDNSTRIYIDEHGNLVIESGSIYIVNTYFGNRFPADSILNPDYEISKEYGYNIYTYETVREYNDSKIYIDGKYYYYYDSCTYSIDTASIESLIRNNWRIYDMRYRYDLMPNEIFSESIPVYDVRVTFVDSSNGPADKYNSSAIFYMIVMNGEVYVLTGAYETGESLLTFEGYMPADEYFDSLVITTEKYSENYYYIDGEYTFFERTKVILSEKDYPISKELYFHRTLNGGYVYNSIHNNLHILHIDDEFTPPANYVLGDISDATYYQGVYKMAHFTYDVREKYKAIRIGDRFYDYEDFAYSWHHPDWKVDYNRFREIMYGTERVYRVYDSDLGDYRYYEKFIPGEYFVMYDEIFDVQLPDEINETPLGYDKYDNEVVEIWYYTDESLDSSIETTVLSDGSVFYHINGIGYVNIVNTSEYVKAFSIEKSDGTYEVVCVIRSAYISDSHLREFGYFEDYISASGYKVVIPEELVDLMYGMSDNCYFTVSADGRWIEFNYYTLKAYFENGGGFGGSLEDNKPGYGDDYDKEGEKLEIEIIK